MKQSDSTNSLTELNKDDPSCFICLEIHTVELPLINSSLLRSCGCKFNVHAPCWNEWMKEGKSDYDCPMCGKRSLQLGLKLTAPFQIITIAEEETLARDPKCSMKCLYITVALILAFFIALIFMLVNRY